MVSEASAVPSQDPVASHAPNVKSLKEMGSFLEGNRKTKIANVQQIP